MPLPPRPTPLGTLFTVTASSTRPVASTWAARSTVRPHRCWATWLMPTSSSTRVITGRLSRRCCPRRCVTLPREKPSAKALPWFAEWIDQPWFRIFNPITQALKFDPSGEYVKKYVPELSSVPNEWIHTPWLAPNDQRHRWVYPNPIIGLDEGRQRFLAAAKMHLKRDTP